MPTKTSASASRQPDRTRFRLRLLNGDDGRIRIIFVARPKRGAGLIAGRLEAAAGAQAP